MDIEANIKNAESLFRSYYLNGGGSEDIIMSSHILEEHGLSGKPFWEIVCPELMRRGVLKSFDPEPKGLDPTETEQLTKDIFMIREQCLTYCNNLEKHLTGKYKDLFDTEQMAKFYEPRFRNDVIKPIEVVLIRFGSIGRMHSFKINGKSLSQTITKQSEDAKQKIVIDFKKGIFDANASQKRYEIKGKKRLAILKFLCENLTARLEDFAGVTSQNDALLVRELGAINKLFKTKVGVGFDLIVHSGAVGYFLNREEFDIEIKTLT